MNWTEYPQLTDRHILWGCVREGLSVREIAARIGCGRGSVETALRAHSIKRPIITISEKMRERLNL